MFGRLLGWYTIYTFSEALASNEILLGAKFTLRPSLVRSPILAALLVGTRAVDISRTLPPSAADATYIRVGRPSHSTCICSKTCNTVNNTEALLADLL